MREREKRGAHPFVQVRASFSTPHPPALSSTEEEREKKLRGEGGSN
jgi:hypothetical protein